MTRARRTVVVAVAVAAIVTAANASHGAYFSQSWGWVALAFLVPTTVLLILDRVTVPGRLRIAFASLMGSLGVWIALSSLWSISAPASMREVERTLVYVAVALAVAIILRRGDGPAVLAGVLIGIGLVSSYGLATRLFPDRFDTYADPIISNRLAEPLGYWNALGILATMGLIVAIGFVAHARRTSVALASAAVIPVLALTLYFTFSRGAWGSLAIGLMAAAAGDPRRLRLLWTAVVVSVPSVVCVGYATQQDVLTTEDAPNAAAAAAAREGHRVAVALCVAICVSALVAAGARAFAERARVSPRSRRVFDLALVGSVVVILAGAVVAAGGPSGLKARFDSEPVAGVDLNDRLFSISAHGRVETFGVAWRAWRERPFVGHGSGSFEYVWYENRPSRQVVRDAHSLYLETLMELGVVGLALLILILATAAVGAIRARRQRFVAAGLGSFVAWSAASAFDWHWEMVGVTIVALLSGSVGLFASERRPATNLLGGTRLALVGITSVLSVFAVWSLVGNQALFAGRESVARKEWSEARRHARRAQALLPWSYEPAIVLGDAAAGMGDREAALRAYRDAVATDPRKWAAWLRLAQVARGAERRAAYDRVHRLNPLEEGLPGE